MREELEFSKLMTFLKQKMQFFHVGGITSHWDCNRSSWLMNLVRKKYLLWSVRKQLHVTIFNNLKCIIDEFGEGETEFLIQYAG